jgi:hypothetical protein
MAFRKVSGRTMVKHLPMTPSTAITSGSLVTFASGKLVAAVAGTTAPNLVGVIRKTITAADADYAADRLVPVEIPLDKHVTYEFPTTGLVAADIGVDVDLTDANTVNRAATAIGVVRTTKVLSATKGQGFVKINGSF